MYRYLEIEICKMLKVLTHFFIKEFKKSKKETLDTIENSSGELNY